MFKKVLIKLAPVYLQARTRVAPRFARSKAVSAPRPVFAPVMTIT